MEGRGYEVKPQQKQLFYQKPTRPHRQTENFRGSLRPAAAIWLQLIHRNSALWNLPAKACFSFYNYFAVHFFTKKAQRAEDDCEFNQLLKVSRISQHFSIIRMTNKVLLQLYKLASVVILHHRFCLLTAEREWWVIRMTVASKNNRETGRNAIFTKRTACQLWIAQLYSISVTIWGPLSLKILASRDGSQSSELA